MTPAAQPVEVPEPPDTARRVFGDRLPLAERYVSLLAETGIERGLIGPREAPRLWERHLLNCAVVAELIPQRAGGGTRLIDVGSGAGLPGLVLAIARPDLEVHLVEPLARRTAWLEEVLAELAGHGLGSVTVHTARAEALWGALSASWVTARAVAGLTQLAAWTLPLLADGGSLLALKGARAREELLTSESELRGLGVVDLGLHVLGGQVLVEPARVVRMTIGRRVEVERFRAQGSSSSGSARRRPDRGGRASAPSRSARRVGDAPGDSVVKGGPRTDDVP